MPALVSATTGGPWLVAVGVALVGSLGTYLAVVRKLSGKIGTSEAASLWEESAAIRADYREQLAAAARRSAVLEQRVARCDRENRELRRKVEHLEAELGRRRGD